MISTRPPFYTALNTLPEMSTIEEINNELERSEIRLANDAELKYRSAGESLLRKSAFGRKKSGEPQAIILMYEIDKHGRSCYKNLQLRDLLQYILPDQQQAHPDPESDVGDVKLRDLRRLDYQINTNEERAILVRKHAVLVSLDPLRALITADRLLLIVPPGADTLLSLLETNLLDELQINELEREAVDRDSNQHSVSFQPSHDTQTLRQASAAEVPFELHAYEALLATLLYLERQHFLQLRAQLRYTLRLCDGAAMLPIPVHEELRTLNNSLCEQLRRVSDVRRTLVELTEEDEDMALMNLTALRRKPALRRSPLCAEILSQHEIVDELIGSYVIDFAALEGELQQGRAQIQSAQSLLSLRLDASQNQLLFAEVALAVLCCSFAMGAYVGSLFGMNLDQTEQLEHAPYSFVTVVVLSVLLMLSLGGVLLAVLYKRGVFPRAVKLSAEDRRRLQ